MLIIFGGELGGKLGGVFQAWDVSTVVLRIRFRPPNAPSMIPASRMALGLATEIAATHSLSAMTIIQHLGSQSGCKFIGCLRVKITDDGAQRARHVQKPSRA
eukprot:6213414-Pleurochrysis_carterae.AAC.10